MTQKNRMAADKTISGYLHNLRHQRSIIILLSRSKCKKRTVIGPKDSGLLRRIHHRGATQQKFEYLITDGIL